MKLASITQCLKAHILFSDWTIISTSISSRLWRVKVCMLYYIWYKYRSSTHGIVPWERCALKV